MARLPQQLHSEVHADARLYYTLREEAAMLDHVQELLGKAIILKMIADDECPDFVHCSRLSILNVIDNF